MKTAVLIGAATAIAVNLGCHRRADPAAVVSKQSALDFGTGDVQGAVFWNGSLILNPLEVGNGHQLLAYESSGLNFRITDTTFSADNLAPGDHTLGLYQGDCSDASSKLGEVAFTVTAGASTVANFDLTSTAGRVTGTITTNGAPVASVFLELPFGCGVEAMTDADGRFSMLLAPGTYVAKVQGAAGVFGSVSFTVIAGQTTDLQTVAIAVGGVQGAVFWNGSPILNPLEVGNGHQLLAYESSGLNFRITDTTFSADNLAPGDYTLGLYQGDCSDASSKLGEVAFTVTAGASTVANFDLTSTAGRVTGTITANGAPVASAFLELPFGCGVEAMTDANGRFSMLLAPGTYNAQIRGPAGTFGNVSFTVLAGQTTDLQTVAIAVGGVQGAVFWNGSPILNPLEVGNGHQLLAYESSGLNFRITDTTFSADNLAPGDHTLGLYQGDCSDASSKLGEVAFTVTAGASTVANFDLTSTAGRVTGTITANGAPVASAFLELPFGCGVEAMTDANGRFSMLLAPGTYNAQIRGPAGTFGNVSFTVLAGQTTDIDSVNTPAQANLQLDLLGGTTKPDGLSLLFTNVSAPGNTVVVSSGSCVPSCSPPPTGYAVVGSRYWDLSTTAVYSGPITVCLAYDPQDVCGQGIMSCAKESTLKLVHDAGSGFMNITSGPVDTVDKIICGVTTSLSPFAIVVPIDAANTPPRVTVPGDMTVEAAGPGGARAAFDATATDAEDGTFPATCLPASNSIFPLGVTPVTCTATDSGGLSASASFTVTVRDTIGPAFGPPPAPIIAKATSTSGAVVTYTAPSATDGVAGTQTGICTPASGSTFAPGQTTVSCTAADASGNTGRVAFTIWVQYDAPKDGTFFLKPIRPDGSSVFKIGRAVPVKFALTGASAGITNLVAKLVVTKVSDQIRGTVDDDSDEDGDDTDFLFKYRKAKGIYGYRWKTLDQTRGTYRLRADLGDGVVHQVDVSLRTGK